jgi:hypothetical protein
MADGSRALDSGYIAVETAEGTKRLRANDKGEFPLTHTTWYHAAEDLGIPAAATSPPSSDPPSPTSPPPSPKVNEEIRRKVKAVERLDTVQILTIAKVRGNNFQLPVHVT